MNANEREFYELQLQPASDNYFPERKILKAKCKGKT